ncbi:MAG: hypothetical protein N3A55_03090 [Methylohalobius sp.]|nr:hypothetical protein [Methylohalobius sp.]
MSNQLLPEDEVVLDYLVRLLGESGSAVEEELPPGCPPWAKQAFQVQPFRIGKLCFAVPARQLQGAWALEGKIIPRSEQPEWASGQVKVAERWVWVVELAGLLLSGTTVAEPASWILLPRTRELGLLCCGVEKLCLWQPHEVRWRSERIRRPWLLGMHCGFPFPLIDVECLIADLKP